MSRKKYTVGLDFGTKSARAVLVDLANGKVRASSVYKFKHGVITEKLPQSGVPLDPDWALQDPNDYLVALKRIVKKVLRDSGVNPTQIIAVGVDFTSSTIIPTLNDGTPLCTLDEYKNNPHSWVKLWKHHAAQEEANQIIETAFSRFESFLDHYGGKINAEWFFPKILQVLNESTHLYHTVGRFIEAGDWIVWKLTGKETRNLTAAGYKALWSKNEGYPSDDFFKALNPSLEKVVQEKMLQEVTPVGQKVGEITEQAAHWTGLNPGTAVATAMVNAHAAMPASTVVSPGKMVIIMDTSNVHLILSKKEYRIPGMCGMVEDGIVPGYYGFEAGQACMGDHFAWFIKNCIPSSYEKEAHKRGLDIYKLLEEKAAKLQPGETGMVALDWWNGNRSILVDGDLSGMMLGLNLATKPEEIFRTLLEATAFGTRKIIEAFIASGVPINEIVATGSIPHQNQLLMQIFANVTNMEIKVADCQYTSALGSAMYAAVAAGKQLGGYANIQEAAQAMAHLKEKSYLPETPAKKIYDRIYTEYTILHDYFGYAHNDAMKRLKSIRTDIFAKRQSQRY